MSINSSSFVAKNEINCLDGNSNRYSRISIIINGITMYTSEWQFIGSGNNTVNFNINY